MLEALASWKDGDGWPSWAFSNHDAPRVVSRWGSADRQDDWAKLLLALLMGLRGNVFLYQGEELGLSQAQIPFERLRDPEAIANWPSSLGRDGARTPMPWSADGQFGGFSKVEPWLPMPEEHKRRAVTVQDKDPNSVLECTRQLVALRKTHPALRLGKFVSLKLPSPLLGFERVETGERIRCLFNLGDKAVRWPMIKERSTFVCQRPHRLSRKRRDRRTHCLLVAALISVTTNRGLSCFSTRVTNGTPQYPVAQSKPQFLILIAGTGVLSERCTWFGWRTTTMGHYEIRIQKPDGSPALSWKVEQADDMSALSSALEMCENQKVEVWEGHRRIASISLSGQPRLTL